MIYIDYGVSIIRKKALKIIPLNRFFSTSDFFSLLVEKNELSALEVKKRFYHIGTPEALEEFRSYIRSR